jgi:hypothetical protein
MFMMMTMKEIEALDTWRFQKLGCRDPRAAGLSREGFDHAASGSRSQDYGVTTEERRRFGKNGDGAGSQG